jgi:hypothetical protein
MALLLAGCVEHADGDTAKNPEADSATSPDTDSATPPDTATCEEPCICGSAAWLDDGRAFATVQAALTNVGDGGTVFVCPGEHVGNLSMFGTENPVWQSGSLSIIGEDASTTTLRGAGGAPVIHLASATTLIRGVTITGGTGLLRYLDEGFRYWEAGGGIMNPGADLELDRVVITGNSASDGGGLYFSEWEDVKPVVTVRDSAIIANVADDDDGLAGPVCGGGACLGLRYQLISIDTDWGVAESDNQPDDISLNAVSSWSFEGVASFVCDSDTGVCI